jgi:hypothetical protein
MNNRYLQTIEQREEALNRQRNLVDKLSEEMADLDPMLIAGTGKSSSNGVHICMVIDESGSMCDYFDELK